MNFFTSDLHLGNEDMEGTYCRPFKKSRDFEKYLIKNWNKQAKKTDTIYVIGDLFDYHNQEDYDWRKNFKIIKKIKAEIILIIGNNEERIIKNCFQNDFEKFRNYCIENGIKDVFKDFVVEACGRSFFLTHKPKNHNPEMLNLFGHSHKAIGFYKNFGFNVFYDLHDYRLVDDKKIKYLLFMKENYWDKDINLK